MAWETEDENYTCISAGSSFLLITDNDDFLLINTSEDKLIIDATLWNKTETETC